MALATSILQSGTRASQPAAAAANNGIYYRVTDEGNIIEQSTGSAWVGIGGGANGVTAAGTLTSGQPVLGSGSKAVAVGPINLAGGASFVTGIVPVANGGTGSASGAAILRTSVALTNAEILALPTSGKLVLAAQGSGFIIVPLFYLVQIRASAGAYTNVNAACSAQFVTASTAVLMSGYIANDAATTPVLTQIDQLFKTANNRQVMLTADFWTVNEDAGWSTFGDVQQTSDIDNKDLRFVVSNGGSGNFTGGNAANTGRILLYYTVETI